MKAPGMRPQSAEAPRPPRRATRARLRRHPRHRAADRVGLALHRVPAALGGHRGGGEAGEWRRRRSRPQHRRRRRVEPQVAPARRQPRAGADAIPDLPAGTHLIRSPMVGHVLSRARARREAIRRAGQEVKPDTIVCIIEVMKLMNSVEAGVTGMVTHVFVENARDGRARPAADRDSRPGQ